MQSDITPSYDRRPNTKTPKNHPMRSLRLQGHSVHDARKRLAIAETQQASMPPKEPEAEAVIALDNEHPPKKNPWRLLKYHLSKRSKLELVILATIILGGGGAAALIAFHQPHKLASAIYSPPTAKAAPKPATVASPLTGVQVAATLAARPVTGIMIENSTDARPQSGLQDAGVVYEAIAEAGITRFLALFQETSPQYIGPVRSLRPYYIDFAAPYQASIVHVGGSPDALAKVNSGSFRNLDQFYNGSYFTRINARAAPHNVYTSFAELDKLNQSKNYTSSHFTPWPRKADQKLTVPTAKAIDLTISSAAYYVHYDYDANSNTYLRSEGGAPHMDLVSASDTAGVRLAPKVVVALVMHLGYGALDASGAYYSNYTDMGNGTAYIFQDGGVTQGSWSKADTTSPLQLLDSAGQQIKLNAGQTWVTVLSTPSQVAYTP